MAGINFSYILNKSPKFDSFGYLTDFNAYKSKIIRIIGSSSTPLFVIDNKILTKRIDDLGESCLKTWGDFRIAYSFKTNYEIAKLKLLKKKGLWAEVVSEREYQMAKKLGYKGTEIVFNGPSKSESGLRTALNDGALIFVDNFQELLVIQKIANSQRKKFKIGIRLRTKIHRLGDSRFGFSVDNHEADTAIYQINKNKYLSLIGLHIHIGSDIDKVETYKYAASSVADLISKNTLKFKDGIRYLDFGGGFPSHGLSPFGRLKWNPKHIEDYVAAISSKLNGVFTKNKPTLIFEPGRYIADDAVLFITRITNSKKDKIGQILTVDSTISMLPLIQYRPQIIKIFSKDLTESRSKSLKTQVYGASCRENDILYNGLLPKVNIGDIVVFFIVGAYNQNMSSEFIFKKPGSISI